jgi:CheY-like chemotaxis protein
MVRISASSIQIPADWSVFVLDDTEERLEWFRSRLPRIRSAKTAEDALAILSAEKFDAVFLDHDLHWMDAGYPDRQHGNGKEVARYLAYTRFAGKVVIHSRSDQAAVMAKLLPQAIVAPYGEFEIISLATPPPLAQPAGS